MGPAGFLKEDGSGVILKEDGWALLLEDQPTPGFDDAFAKNYLTWPGREAVTLTLGCDGDASDLAVTDAKRRVLTAKEAAASNGKYLANDLVWLVPAILLPPMTRINPGDAVTDAAGFVYTVLPDGANFQTRQTVWKLYTRNLALHCPETVSVETWTAGQDASGARTKTYAATYSGPAAVQPDSADPFEQRGLASGRRQYLVYVPGAVTAQNAGGDFGRVTWGEVKLEIIGVKNASRIDLYTTLTCLLEP